MKWEADTRMGFFGYTTQAKGAPQPRWRVVVDVGEALARIGDVLAVWREVALWPDAPPFSGGVWDSWPQRLARGLAVCRAEAAAVREYLAQERAVPHG